MKMKKHIFYLLALCGVQSHAWSTQRPAAQPTPVVIPEQTSQSGAQIEDQKKKSDQNHKKEIDAIKDQNAEELAQQKADLEATHTSALQKQKLEHEALILKQKQELAQQKADLEATHTSALQKQKLEHEALILKQKQEHEKELEKYKEALEFQHNRSLTQQSEYEKALKKNSEYEKALKKNSEYEKALKNIRKRSNSSITGP
jgi:hypothetical protein